MTRIGYPATAAVNPGRGGYAVAMTSFGYLLSCIGPEETYQTNAVKHFKFTRAQGKRRIHQKPGRTEVVACRPWLFAEIEAVRPRGIVCLGATAAQCLLGTGFRVSTCRGEILELPAAVAVTMPTRPLVVATVHPSSVLRDRSEHHQDAYERLVADLRSAHSAVGQPTSK